MKLLSSLKVISLSLLLIISLQTIALPKMPTDTTITHRVQNKIAMDPSLSVFKIKVETKKNTVYLSGTVNSDTDASAIVQLAQSIAGVKDVDTQLLKIKNSAQPFTDTSITAKVKGTFIREKIFGKDVPPDLKVETNNGIVYLSGTAKSQHEINTAIDLAKSVTGVKKVESRLKLQN